MLQVFKILFVMPFTNANWKVKNVKSQVQLA